MKIKPSMLPAVEAPHPGASYNPAYEDYQVIEDILCNSISYLNTVVCMNKTVSIHSISLFQYSCLYEKSVSIQQLVGII